jgi:hypothetical protein
MEIKTEKGLARPMPLSDLQEYTKELKRRNRIELAELVFKFFVTLMLFVIIFYLIF